MLTTKHESKMFFTRIDHRAIGSWAHELFPSLETTFIVEGIRVLTN